MNWVLLSVSQSVEHQRIHLTQALVESLLKVVQFCINVIEALSDFLFEVIQLLLDFCESVVHCTVPSAVLVLFSLKLAGDELALLFKLSPKVLVLDSLQIT